MALRFGSTPEPEAIYFGSSSVTKVYKGTGLVWEPPASAPITVIASNGWEATYPNVPAGPTLEESFSVTRAGYDALGVYSATAHTDNIMVTRRRRLPGSSSLSTDQVALSEMICTSDTIAGVTNNATEESPIPVVSWAMIERDVVSSMLTLEVHADHYFARAAGPVALVRFTVEDSSAGSVTADVTAMAVSPSTTDVNSIATYRAVINISGLANGKLTANVQAFPWVGTTASVFNSATAGLAENKCAPRYYVKDPKRVTDAPRCYVDLATGNNTTGVWGTAAQDGAGGGTDPSLLPFATYQGAIAASAIAVRGVAAGDTIPFGFVDGAQVRLRTGTHNLAGPVSGHVSMRGAAMIVTRDPAVAKVNVTANAATAFGPRMGTSGTTLYSGIPGGAIRFFDVNFARSANVSISGLSGYSTLFQFVDSPMNLGGFAGGLAPTFGQGWIQINGTVWTNMLTGSLSNSLGMLRGVACDLNGATFMGLNLFGCDFDRPTTIAVGGSNWSNLAWQGVTFRRKSTSAILVSTGSVSTVVNISFVNIIVESVEAAAAGYAVVRISGDNDPTSTRNILFRHFVTAGWGLNARWNHLYVDTDARGDRTHIWNSMKGCIVPMIASKQDLFFPANPVRIGGLAGHHAVGSDGNLHQNSPSSTLPEAVMDYFGPNSVVGPGTPGETDPLFVDRKSTTGTPTAGTGNGDYRLQAGSPAKNILPYRVFPFAINGTQRAASGTVDAGAY